MRTIYIYLSVTGWIWFVIAGSYLLVKIRAKWADGTNTSITGAKQPNEQ